MSRSGQRFWIWVFAAFLVGGTGLGLWLARRTEKAQRQSKPNFDVTLPPNVTLRLKNVRISGRANGLPAWRLRAGLVDTTRGQNQVAFTEGIESEFLQDGQTRAKVTAPKAVYSVSAKEVEASGGVICRVVSPKAAASDELKIETPRVSWSIGARQITCPAQVTVTRPDSQLRGENLVVDLVTREYSLQNVSATFMVDEESTPNALFDVLPMAQ